MMPSPSPSSSSSSSNPLHYHLLLLLLAGILTSALAANTAAGSTDFIRASCYATRYPVLCVSYISAYAADIGKSPIRLAHAASAVSLSRINATRARVKSLALGAAPGGREAAPLKDCLGLLGDAADQTRQSMAVLGALGTGRRLAWRLATVKTWMSAALTNEETCTDGLAMARGAASRAAAAKVRSAKRHSSNALALINQIPGSG